MTPKRSFEICLLPGDGIGVDVIDATVPLLERVALDAPFGFDCHTHPAGALHYRATGDALPARTLEAARQRRRNPLRRDGLARDPLPRRHRDRAAARPARRARAVRRRATGARDPRCAAAAEPTRARRPSTWWSCANRPRACSPRAGKGVIEDDREARDTMVITRAGSERVHDFAFRLGAAAQARGPAGPRDLRRQGERVPLDGVLPQGLRRVRGGVSRHRSATTTTSTPPRSTWCASRGSSTCWSPRTCSATSCPTRPRRWSAAWAWRRRPTSATRTRCSSRATARRPTSPARARPTRWRRSCRRR